MTIYETVENVSSRDDLVRFVQQLATDYQQDAESWENVSIDQFLEALAAWMADMDGYFRSQGQPVPNIPSWALVAKSLLAAKAYE